MCELPPFKDEDERVAWILHEHELERRSLDLAARLENSILRSRAGQAGRFIKERFKRQATEAKRSSLTPMELTERQTILNALVSCGWNKRQAAKRIGIGRQTMYSKIEKYGITPQELI